VWALWALGIPSSQQQQQQQQQQQKKKKNANHVQAEERQPSHLRGSGYCQLSVQCLSTDRSLLRAGPSNTLSLQKSTSIPPPKCPADTVTVPGHLPEQLLTAPLTRISCHEAHPDSEPEWVSSSDKGWEGLGHSGASGAISSDVTVRAQAPQRWRFFCTHESASPESQHKWEAPSLLEGGKPPSYKPSGRWWSFLLTFCSTELSYCAEWQDSTDVTAAALSTAQACHCLSLPSDDFHLHPGRSRKVARDYSELSQLNPNLPSTRQLKSWSLKLHSAPQDDRWSERLLIESTTNWWLPALSRTPDRCTALQKHAKGWAASSHKRKEGTGPCCVPHEL
jgi:hypothetical protein